MLEWNLSVVLSSYDQSVKSRTRFVKSKGWFCTKFVSEQFNANLAVEEPAAIHSLWTLTVSQAPFVNILLLLRRSSYWQRSCASSCRGCLLIILSLILMRRQVGTNQIQNFSDSPHRWTTSCSIGVWDIGSRTCKSCVQIQIRLSSYFVDSHHQTHR